jgi:hypothetical protein
MTIDLDSTICEVHGDHKQGAAYGYTHTLGYHPLLAYGSRLIVADPFYPSKTCSACRWVKAKLTLAERTFTCEACGLRIDRDLNAARNLAKLAQHVAQGGWETQTARGADRKPQLAGQVAMKREAGTEPGSGETGTVQPQGWTA